MARGGASPPRGVSSSLMSSSQVVVGKRRPFWQGFRSWKEPVYALLAPVVLVYSAYWFVGLFRAGHLFDNDHLGHTVIGGGFFALLALFGVFGTRELFRALRQVVLDSACPCCGAERARNFGPPEDSATPRACGACLAYLRAEGTQVSEERAEAVHTGALPYELASEHYLPAVRRDNHNHFKFAWPETCALCGDAASARREVGEWGKIQADLGIVGEVAHMVGVEAGVAPRDYKEMVHHVGTGATPSPGDRLDRELSHLKVPVCSKHTEDAARFAVPIECKSGKLVFASYGYYRAFCELNQIGATLKSVTSATGSPRPSSPQ
jgi:hypothetical protein